MAQKYPNRPRDLNQWAKLMVDLATGNTGDQPTQGEDGKNPAAVQLGRLGGLKGGAARAKKLTPQRRAEIARKAAQARYGKKD